MPAGLDGHRDRVVTPRRDGVLSTVADRVDLEATSHRDRMLIVGIDGVDGAGKSTFADELAVLLDLRGRVVVRATIDSFHAPRSQRWARGRVSPLGYYLDSHQLDVVRDVLLDPLRRGSGEQYCVAVFDEPTDRPCDLVWHEPVQGGIVVVDGIFLHRRELVDSWDLSIWLDGADRVARERITRAVEVCPTDPALAMCHLAVWWSRYDRYVTGQQIYLSKVQPVELADIVIDNNDLGSPTITQSTQRTYPGDRRPHGSVTDHG